MKQNDIVLIIVCVFISGTLSLVLSNTFISAPKNRQAQVEIVESIGTDFTQPDERYFNIKSENPTQLIRIGSDNNPTPFNQEQR